VTRDEAIRALDNIVVATVTSRIRGLESELLLGPDDGMPRECAVSFDNLRTVPKALLAEPITRLGPGRIDQLCRALDAASGC
jgi:mRNA interferase MazF